MPYSLRMQNFVKKMINERDELSARIKKARAAVENPPFGTDKKGIELLTFQVAAMEQYLDYLDQRIRHEEER